MKLQEPQLERAVRNRARAAGVVTWALFHPAGWRQWCFSVLAVLVIVSFALVAFIGLIAMLTLPMIATKIPPFENLASGPIPTDGVLNGLTICFLGICLYAAVNLDCLEPNRRTVRHHLSFLPLQDGWIRRLDLPHFIWLILFFATWLILAELEWFRGAGTPARWALLPIVAAIQTALTLGIGGSARILLPRVRSRGWALGIVIAVFLLIFCPAFAAFGNSTWKAAIWQNRWTGYLPTAWAWAVWRDGLSGESLWVWLAIVPAVAAWWYERRLVNTVPIPAAEVESRLYPDSSRDRERNAAAPEPFDNQPAAARDRIRAALIEVGREEPPATAYQRWLNWPATGHDLIVGEVRGWVSGRAISEWNIAVAMIAANVAGRLFTWLTWGIYVRMGDVAILITAFLICLMINGSLSHMLKSESAQLGFDESYAAALRIMISFLKRLVPWLMLYFVMLVGYEGRPVFEAAVTVGIPVWCILVCAPWPIIGGPIAAAFGLFGQRWGYGIALMVVVSCLAIAMTSFIAGVSLLKGATVSEPVKAALIVVLPLGITGTATLLSRYLYYHASYDL